MHRPTTHLTRRRWHGNLRVVMAAVLLAALALALAPASPARAAPLSPFIDLQGRGLAMSAAGVGLQGLGADTRNLSVTIGGPVRAALLYWAGRDRPCPVDAA